MTTITKFEEQKQEIDFYKSLASTAAKSACRAKEKPMSNDSFLLLKEVYEERDAACERALSQISYLEETLREAQLEIKQLKSCLTDFKSYF